MSKTAVIRTAVSFPHLIELYLNESAADESNRNADSQVQFSEGLST
jgi:hypothetical protein